MSDKPALEALEGGKAEEPEKVIAAEKIREAMKLLRQRHQIVKASMMQVAAGRFDWPAVMQGAADLARIEAQVETLRFVLGEAQTIH